MYGNPTLDDNGRNLIKKMNISHKPMGDWFFRKIKISKNDISLDIGCGGGINLKRLAFRCKKAVGIDISKMSVKMSIEKNKNYIKSNKVEVLETSIENSNLKDNSFSIITAFETIYFWKNIEKSFNIIKNLLVKNGKFYIIINSLEDQKLWPETPMLNLIDENNIVKKLISINFKNVDIIKHKNTPWLIIKAEKL